MAGKFVTFEGVEGAGKSTVIAAVRKSLEARGMDVVCTREPGATALGLKLRQLLLHDLNAVSPWAELFMYLADRVEHIDEVIRPAVIAGDIVICDRFTDSTVAYQGYGRQLPLPEVKKVCGIAQTIDVDRTYLLDIDPEVGLRRAKARSQTSDRLERETLEFHQRIRAGFLALAQADAKRFVVVDAAMPAEIVAKTVTADLLQWFDANG